MTTKTDIEQQRAAFELYARKKAYIPAQLLRRKGDSYASPVAHEMWLSWQAAIALDRQQRGEPVAYRLMSRVSAEPTTPHWVSGAPPKDALEYFDAEYAFAAPQPAEPDPTLPYEQALSTLIDKIIPGLDSGNILADAQTASAALTAEPVKVPSDEMPPLDDRAAYSAEHVRQIILRDRSRYGAAQPATSAHPIPQWLRDAFSTIENCSPSASGMQVFTQMRTVVQSYFQSQPAASAEPVDIEELAFNCGGTLASDGRFSFSCGAWHKFCQAAAPVAAQPSVPDEKTNLHPPSSIDYHVRALYVCGWNACREAMLAAAPTPPADGLAQQVDRAANLQGSPVDESANLQDRAQQDAEKMDAERYRMVRRGQRWSVIDGIGCELRGRALDEAVDAARAQQGGK